MQALAQLAGGGASSAPVVRNTSGPGYVEMGPVVAYPGLDLQAGYNDNLYLRPSNVVGSPITVISPYVRFEMKSGANAYELVYRGDFADYRDSPADNYEHHLLQANARFVFDARNDMRLRAEGRIGSDPRGSTDRAISGAPDQWRQSTLYALYGYGASGAQGRIEVDTRWTALRYTNNRDTTAASDRDTTDLGGTFYWRVAPKTRLLFQARYSNIDYKLPGSLQSSRENYYYAGAQWEATAQTTGYAKFGWMDKRFDDGTGRAESSPSWDLGVRWSPLSYSVVDVTAQRGFVESTGLGDGIVSTRSTIAWTHAWNSRLNHSLYFSNIGDQYFGAGTSRRDQTNTLGLRVDYLFQRWLRLGAEYAYTERDSNDPIYDYRRNLILFTVRGTL